MAEPAQGGALELRPRRADQQMNRCARSAFSTICSPATLRTPGGVVAGALAGGAGLGRADALLRVCGADPRARLLSSISSSRWARSRCCSSICRGPSIIDLLLGGEGKPGTAARADRYRGVDSDQRGRSDLPRALDRLAAGGPELQLRQAADAEPAGAG